MEFRQESFLEFIKLTKLPFLVFLIFTISIFVILLGLILISENNSITTKAISASFFIIFLVGSFWFIYGLPYKIYSVGG